MKNKQSKKENGMIPSDLYEGMNKFVDRKTLLEYINNVQTSHSAIAEDLKQMYKDKFKPFEENFKYKDFHGPPLGDAFFSAKPMILLIGQYSSGKSTFVKYLIDKDYPGIRIGPEPTTDKFVAVMYNHTPNIIPGNALVIDESKNFKPLIKFGSKFLNRFQASQVDSPVLQGLTIIDTPGILTDHKNCAGYDYKGVIDWFADQADRIFLFVDAHKLELSGDFQKILEMIRLYDDKLRIVLNKTDLVNEQELIRIYGALMWFLGQTLEMKEMIQIYVGSFWGQPVANHTNRRLYEFEEFRIFEDLSNLPQESLLRKVNSVVKHTQSVCIHALILSMLKQQYQKSSLLRYVFRKQIKQVLLKNLNKLCLKIERDYDYSRDDFPDMQNLKSVLLKTNLNKIKIYNKKLFECKDQFINEDIPNLIDRINNEKFQKIFLINEESPFIFAKGEGFDEGSLEKGVWIVNKHKEKYQSMFDELKNGDGKVNASKAKAQMMKSNLPAKVLNKIWELADLDKDSMLDWDEFALALYLIGIALKKYEVPNQLPKHLIPPSKQLIIRSY